LIKNVFAVALFLLASSDIAPRILDHIRPHHVTVKDTVNCGSDVASPIKVASVVVPYILLISLCNCSGHIIKINNEMAGARSTNGGEDECVQGFGGEP
jgi:hypothetical protein